MPQQRLLALLGLLTGALFLSSLLVGSQAVPL